jgi:hypothetical protein
MSLRRGDLVFLTLCVASAFLLRDMGGANMALRDLYERKREAYAKWRGVMDTAEKEGRALSAEDKATCD